MINEGLCMIVYQRNYGIGSSSRKTYDGKLENCSLRVKANGDSIAFAGRLAAVSVLMYGLYSLNRRSLARLPLKWSMMRSSMWYSKTV